MEKLEKLQHAVWREAARCTHELKSNVRLDKSEMEQSRLPAEKFAKDAAFQTINQIVEEVSKYVVKTIVPSDDGFDMQSSLMVILPDDKMRAAITEFAIAMQDEREKARNDK